MAQRNRAQEEFERFNKALGGQDKTAPFESSLTSLQGAAKLARRKAALDQLMRLGLAKVRSSGLLQQLGKK